MKFKGAVLVATLVGATMICGSVAAQESTFGLSTNSQDSLETEVLVSEFELVSLKVVLAAGADSVSVAAWQGGVRFVDISPPGTLAIGTVTLGPSSSPLNLAQDIDSDCVEFAVGLGGCESLAPDSVMVLAEVSLMPLSGFSYALVALTGAPTPGDVMPLATVQCADGSIVEFSDPPLLELKGLRKNLWVGKGSF